MKPLKKQRSISPRKIKGYSVSAADKRLFESVEMLSNIQVRHQHKNNPEYTRALQRIAKQIEDIKRRNVAVNKKKRNESSVIRKSWVHKPFT